MNAECVVRAAGGGSVTLCLRAVAPPAAPGDGAVCVATEEAVLDTRALAVPPADDRVAWGGLVGRVVEAGDAPGAVQVGARVSAVGPVARLVALPAATCRVVPAGLAPDVAAPWALLLALVRALDGTELGAAVLVLGGGLVGLVCAQLARAAGAAWVVGVDADAAPCAGSVWAADCDAARRLLPPGGADLLIDTLGDGTRLAPAIAAVRTGGRVLLLATRQPDAADLDLYPDVHRRSLTVTGAPLADAGSDDVRLAAYAQWLLDAGRLVLPAPRVIVMADGAAAERVVSPRDAASVAVRWSGTAG